EEAPVLAPLTQGLHRRLRALEEGHTGLREGPYDLLVEVAAGERAEGDHEAAGALRQRLDHRAAELTRRRAAPRAWHVDAQVHGDDVDGVLAQHDVEELREEAGGLVHRARTVEGIARVREAGQEAFHRLARRRRERRQLDTGTIRGVGRAPALAAEPSQDPDPPGAGRVVARG